MKQYETERREIFNNEYVKVFLHDKNRIDEIKDVLSNLDCVKKVNISTSDSGEKKTLIVYPKKFFDANDLEKIIISSLDSHFCGIVNNSKPICNTAHFHDIQEKILKALDKAKVSIVIAMSWFTNDLLLKKLVEKQEAGVDVKVVIYDDDINKKHGVDFTKLKAVRKVKAENGGIMHNKFCVIDNQIVINGSYNWTKNAETCNNENVTIHEDTDLSTKFSVEFNQLFNQLSHD